jgi:hypothetical protein
LKLYKNIFIFTVLCVFSFNLIYSQSRLEIDVNIGYSHPLLEAYGDNVVLSSAQNYITINGKRWINSDNLGTKAGYTVQTFLKYAIMKQGYVKGLFNMGYNMLYSKYDGPSDNYGVRVQSFSLGTGLEVNPLGKKRFYPSLFGLLRINFMGGETYYHAGLDFFKVTPRFGYAAGINMNYRVSGKIGLYLGGSYSYDNAWGKRTDETKTNDLHTIVFVDKAGPDNNLNNDRRVEYSSFYLGMKFYFR